jgi:hypothetical protein
MTLFINCWNFREVLISRIQYQLLFANEGFRKRQTKESLQLNNWLLIKLRKVFIFLWFSNLITFKYAILVQWIDLCICGILNDYLVVSLMCLFLMFLTFKRGNFNEVIYSYFWQSLTKSYKFLFWINLNFLK